MEGALLQELMVIQGEREKVNNKQISNKQAHKQTNE